MNGPVLVVAAILCVAAASPAHGERKIEYLKEEPPTGSIPYRKVVYVDDGTCPKGEVKEITGGSQTKSIPRQVRCVKRPD
ncbi:MAG TPA: DUF6719 family protein [Methylomirabilota bacterium]|jgi:hypothetical protein